MRIAIIGAAVVGRLLAYSVSHPAGFSTDAFERAVLGEQAQADDCPFHDDGQWFQGNARLLGDAAQAVEHGAIAGVALAAMSAVRDERVAFVRGFSEEALDTRHPGVDPVVGTRAKDGAVFRGKLRRLYNDIPGAAAG